MGENGTETSEGEIRIACVMRHSEKLLKSLWYHAQRYLRRIPNCWSRPFDPRRNMEEIAPWRPHAILAHLSSATMYEQVRALGCPRIVNTSGLLADLPLPLVTPDNHAIGELAARHLLAKGYRRFAFLGDLQWAHFAHQRLVGFRRQIEEAGFEVQVCPDHIRGQADILQQRQIKPANRAVLEWLDQLPPRTGLFVDADDAAAALFEMGRIAGFDLVGKLAVVSGHDMDTPSVPSLTGVRIPEDRWGYEAARLAVAVARGEVEPAADAQILLPPHGIIERESTSRIAVEDEHLSQALAFIEARANQDITVDDVAAAVSLGRRALERRFRNHLGRTILQEIHRVHVEHAKMLLLETDLSMDAIAMESGLLDEKHLRRLFVKLEGEVPSAYRGRYAVR